jgi:hypothetical protein
MIIQKMPIGNLFCRYRVPWLRAKFVNALGKNRAANLWRDLGMIASLPATET